MDYIHFIFNFEPFDEAYSDVLASILGSEGFDSFENIDGVLHGYIQENIFSELSIEKIINNYPIPDVSISYKIEHISGKDWNKEWEKTFEPIQIDDLAYIHSSNYAASNSVAYDIIINPRMAFGSGSHATTRMLLRSILTSDIRCKSVLDLGCGTGILGIAAKMHGCGSLTLVDIDAMSVENSRDNLEMNGISDYNLIEGSLDSLSPSSRYDIIFSNIHLNIHLSLMQDYSNHLNDGGLLYLSGFYNDDVDKLVSAASLHGLTFSSSFSEEGWVVLLFSRFISR